MRLLRLLHWTLVIGPWSFWAVLGAAPAPSSALDPQIPPRSLHSTEVTVIWNKIAPASDQLVYEIQLDDRPVARTTRTHFTASGLTPSTDHRLTITPVFPSPPAASSGSTIGHSSLDIRHSAAAPSSTSTLDARPSTPPSAFLTFRTPAPEPIVNVLAHGAIGDGTTLNTAALQAAINACPPGGIVHIPAGTFLSGALFLKSDMTLEIARDGVLQGTANPDDYTPFIRNRFEGWEMDTHASLLNAGRLDSSGPATLRNLSIRGQGRISGGGKTLSDAVIARYSDRTEGLRARGRLILLMNAENVEISGLTLEQPWGWTVHYIYSENITLRGLTIRSAVRNGDGIDPDSSKNSYIFDTTFDTGDDCIAIKSGKNPEGDVIARPTENIRIFDCRFLAGHGISIGSEMSGGVRGVLVEDCVAGPLLHGLQIKATPARGGFVEDVTVRDCDLRQITIYTELPYNNDGAAAPAQPHFRRFRFENIDLTQADPAKPVIDLNGFPAPGHETRDVTFKNLRLPPDALIKVDRAEDVTFTALTAPATQPPRFEITRSTRITH